MITKAVAVAAAAAAVVVMLVLIRVFSELFWRTSLHPKQLRFEQISHSPRVHLLHNFLSAAECTALIKLADPRMAPSTVQVATTEQSPDRTSYTTNLQKGENNLVHLIETRACWATNNSRRQLEPLQVVRYRPQQFYKPHYDYFVPGKKGTPEALARGGQRTDTLFVYLNDLPATDTGGATIFPKIPLKIRPKQGMAVMFCNVFEFGQGEDDRTLHGGQPPEHSTKYGLNIWFRQGTFT